MFLAYKKNCLSQVTAYLEVKIWSLFKHENLTTCNKILWNRGEIAPNITKTRLYHFDPLKPHFYIVKLGFTGVYIIFLVLLKNIDCGYSLDRLVEMVLTSTYNLCFEQKYEKYQIFLTESFHFLVVKFSVYVNRHVFVMRSNFSSFPQHFQNISNIKCQITCSFVKCGCSIYFFFSSILHV